MSEGERPDLSRIAELRAQIPVSSVDEMERLDQLAEDNFQSRTPLVQTLLRLGLTHGVNMATTTHIEEEVELPKLPDGPTFCITALPLPITHANIDSLQDDKIIAAARRFGEKVEETVLSVFRTVENPVRFTKLLNAIAELQERKYYGPYVIVYSREDRYNIAELGLPWEYLGWVIAFVKCDQLHSGELIVFQATPDVVRLVVAQKPVLVRWNEGYKYLCCVVPQIRSDSHGNYGVAVRSA